MLAIWEEFKFKIQGAYDRFLSAFDADPKKYFRRVFFFLFLSGILAAAMFFLPEKIKEEQVESLVYSTITSDRLRPFDYSKADQTITESKAISVMFSVPKGETYQEVLSIFDDPKKMSELNRPIYYYPIVSDVSRLEKKYQIAKDQVTFVFFDKGKEANRIVAGKGTVKNLSDELIPELNRLPLANIKKLESELSGETASSLPQNTETESANNNQP
ncbi:MULTISPECIES: hypothetical protein [unclassified Enterococcus]|uniref:hypothetical protein n=1 Tax=unclassified Enterococcus TaxID=2608891 RepID=UPI0013ED42DF|nr:MULTISPECIES: hypothetical protein [unclassified Enterococcus]